MGEIIRQQKWENTSLRTPDQWQQALQISLANILNSGFPMFLVWGDELICFYNDAFRAGFRAESNHMAIGKRATEVWPEDWNFIGPLIDSVLATGKPVWHQNQLIPSHHNEQTEDIYWTFNLSLVVNDDGGPGGVLGTCVETTQTVSHQNKLKGDEDLNRLVLESSPDCVKVLDVQGQLQFMNYNGRCIMEIDDFSSFKNKLWADLWGDENRQKVTDAIQSALAGQTA